MWNSVNKILHREKSKPLPDYTSLDTLCSSFSKFFTDKITLIRSNFGKNDHSHDFPEPPHVENTMNQFAPTTTSEVRTIILKSTNASCNLDPFPTRLLKQCIDDLIVSITAIINLSIMGDFNHGNIKWDTLQSAGVEDSTFLCLVQDNFLTQHVLEPTRAARVLDIVLSSQKKFVDNIVIQEPLGSSDHNQQHFNIKIKSDKTKVKQCRRDFRKGNYKEIRKRLAHIDWNDKMKNKTATECWNILRGELDSAIDSFVPMKKQGKRSKKKHLSKEAFGKIRHKQNMWRVYKHTGKDQDYVVYKEALNAATNEVRKYVHGHQEQVRDQVTRLLSRLKISTR